MRIGLAFDLKPDSSVEASGPDDQFEEFDSPETVQALREVIEKLGHTVIELGNGKSLVRKLLDDPVDLVFNFAEGSGVSRSRESRVPALCELLNIPYTGSDPLTLGLALDKDLARRTVEDAGVTTPQGIVVQYVPGEYDGDYAEFLPLLEEAELQLPVIAKPVCEGSSKGIRRRCLIETAEELGAVVVSLWKDYQQDVLIEEFIAGDEVTVGIIGNDPGEIVGMMRIMPKQPTDKFVYSLEVKRNWREMVDYEAPAKLPAKTILAIEDAAISAYEILGCQDLCRIDFRIRDGIPYFIEANPLPGLNPITADVFLIAKGQGWSYHDLIQAILDTALIRLGMKS
jgi:D-alanine-D-alanine ligase